MIDWAAPADWEHRSPDFDKLRIHDDGRLIPAMEYVAELAPLTRELWLDLPRHPNLLDPLEPFENGLLLRYAALDWKRPALNVDIARNPTMLTIANWGVQLTTLFETIFWDADAKDHGSFLAPNVYVDLDGEVRVAFSVHDRFRPPETRIDERSFIYVIGRILESLVEAVPEAPIGQIIARCVESRPSKRFPRLQVLAQACRRLARREPVRVAERLTGWNHVEEAIGWLAVGEKGRADLSFGDASFYSHYERYWEWGLRNNAIPVPRPTVVVEHGLANASVFAPPARATLPLSPARASYLEGREHFLHRRLHEAQICFASAILLDPMMLEAQLLRREVDRTLSRVRATTGTPNAMPIDVPAALRDVRELVVAGRIRDAIAALSTDAYATNVDAPLFRARLLALDGQYALAASAYAAIDDGPQARLGLARVTIDRGKPEAALALLDALLVTRPRDLGALEARARCLDLLGRTEEASEAMKAFVAAVELASDARLSRLR